MGSFGEKLRRERELRGVSLREIADGTKISVRFLQALEEDRVDVLPGGLFPRAFVKQYAALPGPRRRQGGRRLRAPRTAEAAAGAQGRTPTPPRRSPVSLGQAFLAVVAVLAVVLTLPPRARAASAPRPEPTPTPVVAAPAVLPTDRVYPSPSLAPAAAAAGRQPRADDDRASRTAGWRCAPTARPSSTACSRRASRRRSRRAARSCCRSATPAACSIRVNDRPALPLGRSGEVRKNIVITRQNLPSLVEQDGAVAPDGHSG